MAAPAMGTAGDPVTRGGSGRPALRVIEGGAAVRERRRRWLRAAAVVTAVLLAVVLIAGAVGAAPSTDGQPAEAVGTATVEPGETLWDVAVTHAPPGTDPRAYLDEVQRLNGIDGAVRPWTVVLLPAAEG